MIFCFLFWTRYIFLFTALLPDLPYGFFTLLRFIVCIGAGYLAWIAYAYKRNKWVWAFSIISILFNPFIPIYLARDIWIIIDIIVGAILIISIFLLKSSIPNSSQPIRVLLSYNVDSLFKDIFEKLGYDILHTYNKNDFSELIRQSDFDFAIEWQRSKNDHMILDLMHKYDRFKPVLLSLNWNGKAPDNYKKLGYIDCLDIPFKIDSLIVIIERQYYCK